MATVSRSASNRITAVTAAIQAVFLLGYAITIAVLIGIRGADGPEAVASEAGVVAEIVTFALFGVGVGVVAVGRWRGSSWSSVPFFVTQALALAAGGPVLFGPSDTVPRLVAAVVCLSAIVGLVALVAGRDTAESSSESDTEPGSSS